MSGVRPLTCPDWTMEPHGQAVALSEAVRIRGQTPDMAEADVSETDDVLGLDGHAGELETRRVPERRDDRGGRDDRRRLADAFRAVGRVGLGILDQLGED